MEFIQNFGYFIVFIGSLVFFHELGHFAVAKFFDVKVLSFSLGFGPELFSFRRGETTYRVALLPLGGYVKMVGELPGMDMDPEDLPRALTSKPLWQRTAVVAAGPIANFLLALVVYFGMFVGPHTFADTKLGVVSVGDPAWNAGIRAGDKLLSINGKELEQWSDVIESVGSRPDEELMVEYERAGTIYSTKIRARGEDGENVYREKQRRGKIGILNFFIKPEVAILDEESPAFLAGVKSGDVITHVADIPVSAWHEVRQALMKLPSDASLTVAVLRGDAPMTFTFAPDVQPPDMPVGLLSSADMVGGYTGLVSREVVVQKVDPDTPAAHAGLKVGDRLVKVSMKSNDGAFVEKPIGVWSTDLASFQGADARNEFTLRVQRGRSFMTTQVQLASEELTDDFKNVRTRYIFGAFNDRELFEPYRIERDLGYVEALAFAGRQVFKDASLITEGMSKLATGVVPMSDLGGPIMLWVIAEKSARRSLQDYLHWLAVISVNLGLLNLLPIPVLDGGHLLMFGIEAVRRRPPSVRVRETANLVGMVLLLFLMVIVFSNDIMRFIIP